MQQHHTRTAPTRQLRLVAGRDARATQKPAPARAKPALAVWPLERRDTEPLPPELARQLIAHYSDPGALVVATPSAGKALRTAHQLNRRVLPLAPRARTTAAGVTQLRASECADLAIAALGAAASSRAAAKIAARLREALKPGGFLVLALDGKHGPLGAIVRACQKQGLQYWQHIVALDPRQLEHEHPRGETAGDPVRSIRCHRDLLVFRALPADAAAGEAQRAAVAA